MHDLPTGRHAKVACQCVCKRVREVRVDDLKSGGSVSCGCMSTQNALKHSDDDALLMLASFISKYGYANVPRTVDDKEYAYLSKWLIYKRTLYRKGALPRDLEKKLLAAGVSLVPLDQTKDEFVEYVNRTKALPSRNDQDSTVARLGRWLHRERRKIREGRGDKMVEKLLDKFDRKYERKPSVHMATEGSKRSIQPASLASKGVDTV